MARSLPKLRLVALRPLLLGVVVVFLGAPMLVYNLVTLNYANLPRMRVPISHFRAETVSANAVDAPFSAGTAGYGTPVPDYLQSCLNASSVVVTTTSGVQELQETCFSDPPRETSEHHALVPNVVHFVYLPLHAVPLLHGEKEPESEPFTYVQFAAVQSIRRAMDPTMIVMHYPATEPRSFWYTQCQRHLSLHRVVMPKMPVSSSLSIHERRDILQLLLMLRALSKQGGVAFSDFNTFVLRSFQPWNRLRWLGGLSSGVHPQVLGVSTRLLQAAPQSVHTKFLEETLQSMFERDDIRLRDTSLEQLLGELLLESYASTNTTEGETHAVPNAVLAERHVLDAVPLPRLTAFLRADVSDPSAVSLNNTTAFSLRTSDPERRSPTSDEEIMTLAMVQDRFADGKGVAEDKTLFGAILRFAVSQNTTTELDAHLLS